MTKSLLVLTTVKMLIEIADYVVNEVKIVLHIIDEPLEPKSDTRASWPEIQPTDTTKLDKLAYHVHLKVRHVTEKLQSKLMLKLPIIISKITAEFVKNEINEKIDSSKTGISFVDNLVTRIESTTGSMQQKITQEFVEFLWDGVDDTVGAKLVSNLVELEQNILFKFKETASILPGI